MWVCPVFLAKNDWRCASLVSTTPDQKNCAKRSFATLATEFWNVTLAARRKVYFLEFVVIFWVLYFYQKKVLKCTSVWVVAPCRYTYSDMHIHKYRRTCMISTVTWRPIIQWWTQESYTHTSTNQVTAPGLSPRPGFGQIFCRIVLRKKWMGQCLNEKTGKSRNSCRLSGGGVAA